MGKDFPGWSFDANACAPHARCVPAVLLPRHSPLAMALIRMGTRYPPKTWTAAPYAGTDAIETSRLDVDDKPSTVTVVVARDASAPISNPLRIARQFARSRRGFIVSRQPWRRSQEDCLNPPDDRFQRANEEHMYAKSQTQSLRHVCGSERSYQPRTRASKTIHCRTRALCKARGPESTPCPANTDHLRLRHVFIRKPDTFAPKASVLETAERHRVKTIV
ncbi:hypothetical protein P3T25_008069 [Paraburkholderia sp. GAS32]